MAIDPRIALGVQPVQPVNMLGVAAQGMALQAAAQEMEGNQAMREAFAQGGDLNSPEFQRRVLAANPKLGQELIKRQAEIGKVQNEAIAKRIELSREMLTGVNTPEDYIRWHESNHADPVLGPYFAQRGVTADQSRARIIDALSKPGGLEKLKQESALGAAKAIAEQLQTERSVKVAGISAAATMRGQNMTDARAREQMEFTRGKPIGTQVGADGVLYGIYADGSAKPIQMAGAPAPATDATAPVNNLGPTAPAAAPVNAMMAPAPNSAVAPGGGFRPQPPTQPYESSYAAGVGKGQAERDEGVVSRAQTAATNIPKLDETLQLLRTGDVTTGFGAELRLNIDRARSMFTNDIKAGKRVADTQILDAMLGSDVFPMIQSLGIGARGLDTPAERDYLRQVMTGTIPMDKDALIRLTEIRRNIEQRAVEKYNKQLDTGQLNKYFQTQGIQASPLEVPPAPKAATTKAATSTAPRQSPTTKAPPVGAIMDGYRFKGGNPADPNSWEKQ